MNSSERNTFGTKYFPGGAYATMHHVARWCIAIDASCMAAGGHMYSSMGGSSRPVPVECFITEAATILNMMGPMVCGRL